MKLYVTLVHQFDKILDQLGIDYEDATKRRRKITLHSFRRFVKTTISDLGYQDFSEFFIRHSESTYWRKSEKEKVMLFQKIEPYLTFLNQTSLERKGADIQTKLEERDKEIADIKSRFDLMQSQMQSLISSLGNIQDQSQINQMAKTLYNTKILNTKK